jgi:two-component system, OmpR family, sensor histidine kinase KdpD
MKDAFFGTASVEDFRPGANWVYQRLVGSQSTTRRINRRSATYRPTLLTGAGRVISRIVRTSLAAGVIGLVLAIAVNLRHVNTTTVALVLVLAVLCIAMTWGWLESTVAAIVAGLGLAYFFLPPDGFAIEQPEHWVAFLAFLTTALAAGHLSARANRHRAEAIQRREEIEKLYRVAEVISQGENREAILQRLSGALSEILELDAVAIYDAAAGRVCRSGTRAGEMTDAQLRHVALCGIPFSDTACGISVVPVQEDGELAGSIGIAGIAVSSILLKAIAAKVGSALSKARVEESLKESEISRRADELKSAIYDALAHEARGPLSSINIAATTLLSERPGNAAQQREMLSIIKEEVDRMNQWIDKAARTVRTETRQLKLSTGPQGVRDLVSGAIDPLRHLLQGRQVCIEIEDCIPMAECDAEMTQRVLRLLLDNALKYSPLGTPITIAASVDYGTIDVSVSDAGPGVPEEQQARIFEKHYRGSQHNSVVPGTGLGLASAKRLVDSQGGEIWMTNRPKGGAEFHFSVPMAEGLTT